MSEGTKRQVAAWIVVALLGGGATVMFDLLGLPSPPLFGFLFGGMVYALSARGPVLTLPGWGSRLGQALIGVEMGAYVDLDTVRELGPHGLPILAACLTTLALSIAAGPLLSRHPDVDGPTGVFAMIAGGASGITAVAGELGADDRIVGVVQYLRVVLVLVLMPLITAVVFRPPSGVGQVGAPDTDLALDLVFTVVAVAVGLAVGRLLRFPAASLLGPLLVSTGLVLWAPFGPVAVPALLAAAGFALVGGQVGLRFTATSLRVVARILPRATALILALIAVCAGMGVLLAGWTGKSHLDGYLATTPGGLYAVLATAADSGADVTFVLAVQVIRLFVVLAAAPLLSAWLRRRYRPPAR